MNDAENFISFHAGTIARTIDAAAHGNGRDFVALVADRAAKEAREACRLLTLATGVTIPPGDDAVIAALAPELAGVIAHEIGVPLEVAAPLLLDPATQREIGLEAELGLNPLRILFIAEGIATVILHPRPHPEAKGGTA